jgi:hypothetical protein
LNKNDVEFNRHSQFFIPTNKLHDSSPSRERLLGQDTVVSVCLIPRARLEAREFMYVPRYRAEQKKEKLNNISIVSKTAASSSPSTIITQ